LTTSDIKDEKVDNATTIQIELGYRFEKEGDYEIVCSLKDYPSKLKIPLRIKLREWPVFSVKEIRILENNKSLLPHKVSAQVKCRKCNQHYVFEEKILPSEVYSGGTLPFPETGIYECEHCDHKLKLKDIQGQIRASIKDNLLQFINHKAHV
jgi:DNA-directed RNA polymerase subunit M/transcription elongation factor TFIIS